MSSIGDEFLKLIETMNPYTTPTAGSATAGTMHFGHLPPTAAAAKAAAARGSKNETDDFQVEIDNYKGEWTFRGGTEQIKRSLRITYRYEIMVKDAQGHERKTGLYATEHLLIGYAGGNH